jgi:hypothetical protein
MRAEILGVKTSHEPGRAELLLGPKYQGGAAAPSYQQKVNGHKAFRF